ncbi:MAG: citrulline utilization hydrolase CtlX [Phycisphaerales bacterium]
MSRERTQTASRVLMIRPTGFGRDEQAAQSNRYMNMPTETADCVRDRAMVEFDMLSKALIDAGVRVLIYEDEIGLPDSVFPNNWLSFHQPMAGTVGQKRTNPVMVTYPMLAQARRQERRSEVLDAVIEWMGIAPDHVDLTRLEESDDFLEGTGSLVLDRVGNVAYACFSDRTTEDAFDTWCEAMNYEGVSFHAADAEGNPIYHTNVMMSIGSNLAVVCLDSITDPDEYDRVEQSLKASGREIVLISLHQVTKFCGNILELHNQDGDPIFAMSQCAYDHFSDEQRARIESYGRIVHVDIPTIEFVAGGSVRCMIAELGI